MNELMNAIRKGDLMEVKRLLKAHDIDINGFDDKRTPLMNAAAHGHADIVQLLIQRGADLNTQDRKDKRTALMMAAGHLKVVKLLLRKGAKLDICEISDHTALYFAAKAENLESVKALLKAARQAGLNSDAIGWDEACREVKGKMSPFQKMLGELHTFQRRPINDG